MSIQGQALAPIAPQNLFDHSHWIGMRYTIEKLWNFLRHSTKTAVWERRFSLAILCALFSFGQSIPAALAIASQGDNSWTVVCTGNGLQVLRTGEGQENLPTDAQFGCACCLAPDNKSLASKVFDGTFIAPEIASSITYPTPQINNSGHLARLGLSCRGPPEGAPSWYAFSDPPDVCFNVTDRYLRKFRL